MTTSDLTRWIVNNKEIVKYFYEDVVSKNLIDEAAHFLSAEDVEEITGFPPSNPDLSFHKRSCLSC